MAALHHILPDAGNRPVLVGLSGGLDSVVLLHLLAGVAAIRARGLRTIHVHHGLHPDADTWAAHCQAACDALGVPLQIARVEVVSNRGDGPESAARKARHAAFDAALHDGEALALAHHRHDQAETFLLRALRGSGPDGLGAMRAWRTFGRGWLWRPLLDVARGDLLAYATQHGLDWIEDPSNTDTTLDRNFLRHRVLPLLRERWPHADAAFARSAALSAEAVDLLDEEDARALATVRGADPHVIDMSALLRWPAARRARLLRRWTAELGLPALPWEGVARIEHALLAARPDSDAEFAWAGAVIRRWRGLLQGDWQRAPLPPDWQATWDGRESLPLPCGGSLILQGANGFDAPLQVHARRAGERIALPGRAHSHALKHVLQELGVPPWVRGRLPLVSDAAGALLAVGDLVYSAKFDAWLHACNARLVWSQA